MATEVEHKVMDWTSYSFFKRRSIAGSMKRPMREDVRVHSTSK
jgi:hypothetical protein